MKKEILEFLRPNATGLYADLTFGEGGHTESFLEAGAQKVIAFDRDGQAIQRYMKEGKYAHDPRLEIIYAPFSTFAESTGGQLFDGVLADLGVSTRQLLTAERGFSFDKEGPLDMRMDPDHDRPLHEVLEKIDERRLAEELAKCLTPGESRFWARRLKQGEFRSTVELAKIARKRPGQKSHPATALFLALRVMVNDELGEVATVLPEVVEQLKPGARFAVLTFHSSEDRLVKRAFKTMAGACVCAMQPCACPRVQRVRILTTKPLEPSAAEQASNPRSRSAKLRVVEKI